MMNSDLRARCEAIARIEIQRRELAEEVKAIKAKAKADGYDAALITKTVAVMIKPAARQKQVLEQHSLFDNYLNAVGLLRDDDQSSNSHLVTVTLNRGGVPIEAGELVVGNEYTIDRDTGEITDTENRTGAAPATSGEAGAVAGTSAPAAPIPEQESEVLSTGGGEPLTDETTYAVSDSSCHSSPVKYVGLTDTIPENLPVTVPPVPCDDADQAADSFLAGGVSAADLSDDDLAIPDFLKRKPIEARAAA